MSCWPEAHRSMGCSYNWCWQKVNCELSIYILHHQALWYKSAFGERLAAYFVVVKLVGISFLLKGYQKLFLHSCQNKSYLRITTIEFRPTKISQYILYICMCFRVININTVWFLCEWDWGLFEWGQGDPGFWFPLLPGGFCRHRVICSEISSTVCFAGGWEWRQGVVGNERSNLLSVGCECVYCCTAVGLVLCWYVLWSNGSEAAVHSHG